MTSCFSGLFRMCEGVLGFWVVWLSFWVSREFLVFGWFSGFRGWSGAVVLVLSGGDILVRSWVFVGFLVVALGLGFPGGLI